MARFGLSEIQAQTILDMRLKALQGLEREKLQTEYDELLKRIEWFKQVLADESLLKGITSRASWTSRISSRRRSAATPCPTPATSSAWTWTPTAPSAAAAGA